MSTVTTHVLDTAQGKPAEADALAREAAEIRRRKTEAK